jgi:anti-sigma-K factor RskA
VSALDRPALSCAEADDLAGVYVLGALERAEEERVREHLAHCHTAHVAFAEVASVVPALATLAEPVRPPLGLRELVLSAVAADADATDQADGTESGTRPKLFERRRARWLTWAGGVATAAVILVLSLTVVTLHLENARQQARVAELANALAMLSRPDASIALLRGSGPATGASGFAVVDPLEGGYIVLTGLPEAPSGATYQAWYVGANGPISVGLLEVAEDGYAILAGLGARAGPGVIAVTLEPAGGSPLPTSEPVVVGELTA